MLSKRLVSVIADIQNIGYNIARKLKQLGTTKKTFIATAFSDAGHNGRYLFSLSYDEKKEVAEIIIYPKGHGYTSYIDSQMPNNIMYPIGDGEFFYLYYYLGKEADASIDEIRHGYSNKYFPGSVYNDFKNILLSILSMCRGKKMNLKSGDNFFLEVYLDDEKYHVEVLEELTDRFVLNCMTILSVPNKKIKEEVEALGPSKDYEAVFYIGTVAPLVDEKSGLFFLLYGNLIGSFDEVCLVEEDSVNNILAFLLECFAKYGLPKKLVFNNMYFLGRLVRSFTPTLQVEFNRYDLEQTYYAKDILCFAEAYILKHKDKYDLKDFNNYLKIALKKLNEFLLLGYDPTKEKLAEDYDDYYAITGIDDNNNSDLVS